VWRSIDELLVCKCAALGWIGISDEVGRRNTCSGSMSVRLSNVVTLTGDLWTVVCSSTNWRRNDKVRLRHVVTNK